MHVVTLAVDATCCLGGDLASARVPLALSQSGLLEETIPADWNIPPHTLRTGRLTERSPLTGRRYGTVSNLAVHLAHRALDSAKLTHHQRRDCPIFVASSRCQSRWLNEHSSPKRRISKYAASNSLPAEIAAAVSIECHLEAGHFLISNGCSSGLDALALAWRHLISGASRHALVLAAELPINPEIIRDFWNSGLLPQVNLAEAGAAFLLEAVPNNADISNHWVIETCVHRADASNHLSQPPNGGALPQLLENIAPSPNQPFFLIPHATGTENNATAEQAAITALKKNHQFATRNLKPLVGHTLGASGLLELALATDAIHSTATLVKWATAMGGHHTAIRLRRHP